MHNEASYRRTTTITWPQLEYFLRREGFIKGDEEISNITLVRPKSILFRLIRPEVKAKEDSNED